MPTHYTPRLFLHKVPNGLLQAYFTKRNQLQDVQWDSLAESVIEPIYQALLELPEADRREVGGQFRAVSDMAKRQFTPCLIRVARESGIDLVSQFRHKSCAVEMALWTYMNHPDVFDEARAIAYWDRLPKQSLEKRIGLPAVTPQITPAALERFGAGLAEYFQTHQGRGEYCTVEHSLSGNVDFFYAFPSDYADVLIAYDNDGKLFRRQWKPAFEISVAYDRMAGTADIYAEGPKNLRNDITAIFTRTILQFDAEYQWMAKPAYNLQLLLQPDFQFPPADDDNLRWIKIKALRLQKKNSEEGILFDSGSGIHHNRSIHDLIDEALNLKNLPRELLLVTKAMFQAAFETGRKRLKSVNFSITHPACCTLRDSDEELILRRYLRRCLIAY